MRNERIKKWKHSERKIIYNLINKMTKENKKFEEYVYEIPTIEFPEWVTIKLLPPFWWALARMLVNWYSIYYDVDNSLWYEDTPYWEILAIDDTYRFPKGAEKNLVKFILSLPPKND